jgi:hypothetical protein
VEKQGVVVARVYNPRSTDLRRIGELEKFLDQMTLIARSRLGLPPAIPPIEASATEQKNDDYGDKKRSHVHGFSFLRQSVFRGILVST